MIDGGVELNGTHKIVGYADDLALLGEHGGEVKAVADL